jgi:hypothetical protein
VAATALRAYARAAAVSTIGLAAALVAVWIVAPVGLPLVAVAAIAGAIIAASFLWMGWNLRHQPDDIRVARFIEERCPQLEDRLATAVHFGGGSSRMESTLIKSMLADAARCVRALELDSIISGRALRRGAIIAAGISVAFGTTLFLSRTPARQAYVVASMYVFPSRVSFEVTPGDARIRAGHTMRITARMTGGDDLVEPVLRIEGQTQPQALRPTGTPHEFAAVIERVAASFTYAIAAGAATSPSYKVEVLHAPHVARIDLQYSYPPAFGLAARAEEDSGDIYAPLGTMVRLRVKSDKSLASAELVLADGRRMKLDSIASDVAGGEIKVAEDGSYRVALVDGDGIDNPGDTEYFIRTLDDRPPDVRILRPAGDREVTRLEEVTVDARAEDDYGISQFELVYSVRGGPEKAVPFRNAQSGLSVTGSQTLFLEDLNVEPGDFVSYYARARDISRGKRATEARSDIFFLEIKPYAEEFAAAQSNAQSGGSGQPLEELAAAQKEIIIATWKLERRSTGGKSKEDIQSIARAQHELRRRAEQAAAETRAFTSARRRGIRPGQPDPAGPPEDPMTRAVTAMTKAATELDALSTTSALPHEMTALNELLKAQSENRRRQVARQQGGGMGSNRATQDLSTLFDRELQRQQQSNYETPSSSETIKPAENNPLDKIRELASRQDELSRQQQDLAKQKTQMSADELKRQLERLTREQSELRRQAEELSRQLSQDQQKAAASQNQSGQGEGRSQGQSAGSKSLRDISEEMRNAANDLRREDPQQASARSGKALQALRDLERQLQTARPDDRQRRLGDLGLEARQLADTERQLASDLTRMGKSGDPSPDALRRLAGEKERIADRVEKLQKNVKQMAGADRANGRDGDAVGSVDKELDRQQLTQRMRESASTLRDAAAAADSKASNAKPGDADTRQPKIDAQRQAAAEQDLARALDRVAEKIGGASGAQDADTRKLSEQLGQMRDVRDRLSDVERKLDAAKSSSSSKDGRGSNPQSASASGQQPSGQPNAQAPNGSNAKSPNQPSTGTPGGGAGGQPDVAQLQDEYSRLSRQARELMDQIRRDNPEAGVGGYTPMRPDEMVESAPGAEGFKQDFAKWDSLRKDINLALERTETALSAQLKNKETKDRLNAGADSSAPDAYRRLVEKYFQSIASRKKN